MTIKGYVKQVDVEYTDCTNQPVYSASILFDGKSLQSSIRLILDEATALESLRQLGMRRRVWVKLTVGVQAEV